MNVGVYQTEQVVNNASINIKLIFKLKISFNHHQMQIATERSIGGIMLTLNPIIGTNYLLEVMDVW